MGATDGCGVSSDDQGAPPKDAVVSEAPRPRAGSVSMDPMIGRVLLGRYRVERCIGSGGMGSVYIARQTAVDRRVAVKVLRPELLSNDHVRRRFQREAEIVAKLSHPNTIQLFDFGKTKEGHSVMVMELLEGASLSERLRDEGPLSLPETLKLGQEVASALGEAHLAGLVHRDMKPANIFLAQVGGRVHGKVLDFGIARIADEEMTQLTVGGQIFGTPRYMAPEQAMSTKDVDGRADIYGLGLILYECLVGQPPFRADTSLQYLAAHTQQTPPKLREHLPNAPAELELLIDRCLKKDPADRPASADEVAEELMRISQETAVRARGQTVAEAQAAQATQVTQAAEPAAAGGLEPETEGESTPSPDLAPKASRSKIGLIAGVSFGLLGLLAAAGYAFTRLDRPENPPIEAQAVLQNAQDSEAPKARVTVEAEPIPEASPEPLPEASPEPFPEGSPELAPQAKPSADAIPDPVPLEPLPEAGPEASPEASPEAEEPKPEPKPQAPAAKAKSKAKAKAKPKPKPKARSKRRTREESNANPGMAGIIEGPRTLTLPIDDMESEESYAKDCQTSVYTGLAELSTRSCPSDCAIIVDSLCAGTTPAKQRAMSPGRRKVTVVCKQGFKRARWLRFRANQNTVFRCR